MASNTVVTERCRDNTETDTEPSAGKGQCTRKRDQVSRLREQLTELGLEDSSRIPTLTLPVLNELSLPAPHLQLA